MQKFVFYLLFFLLSSLSSLGQNIKHISFDFNMDDFEVLQHNDNTVILSDTHNYFLKSDTLLPALPYIGYNVLIGSTEQYDSHACSDSRSLFRSDVTMAQNPKAIPTNKQLPINDIKSAVSYSQSIYPTEFVEFVGKDECDGYRILTFYVCPFEYDATAKKLYIRKHIDLDIHLKTSPPTSLLSMTGHREDVRNIIRRIVVNPEDLDEQNMKTVNRSSNNLTKQQGFEYVIVTSNQFKSTFQELANWKSRKGIRSKVITIDDVLTYEGSTTKEKIKRALADINGLSYVLLGGDTLNVPTCMCYVGFDEDADSITPADVYYSCLETKNWDKNGNGFYGELNDTICLMPILNVSRAPVSKIEDAQVFVNRIINYESAPDTTNWKNDILMCGTSISGYDSTGEYSDTEIWSNMLYNQFINPFWNDKQCTHFYDTHTYLGENYQFTAANLQIELAKGYTFVNVMTHGEKVYWQMEQGNNYHSDQAKNLENSDYSIITTTACLTNAFDYKTGFGRCLSQHFINNPNSGILAYLGTSRENWGSGGEPFLGLAYGDAFDGRIYKNIFEEKYHRLGKALTGVKEVYRESAMANYNISRKLFMGYNLMGDPEMPIYISKPNSFRNVSIQFVNDSIYINAGTDGFDICFINKSDSTDYYIARDIADSVAVFSRINGIFDVSINKPGYIPYTTTYSDTYLQNITMTGTKSYETGNAMIGSDVTNRVSQGPVVINSGNTTIKATKGATITEDFEVKSGAKFTITNE